MECIKEEVILKLNALGYEGKEVKSLLPDFASDRNTVVGFFSPPTVYGTESYSLTVILGVYITNEIAKGLLSQLSRDLYEWTKSKLIPLFEKKSTPIGDFHFESGSIKLQCLVEDCHTLEKLFEQLPALVIQSKPNPDDNCAWLRYDKDMQEWINKDY